MGSSPAPARALRRDALRNRSRIVASARELFATAGVEVPVEEITRHAGVGMGTLYRHFASKEDLLDAVLEHAFDEFRAAAEQALAAEDGWVGFCGFLEQALALHVANRALKDVLAGSDHGRTRAQQMRARMRPLLGRLIERAQAEGTLRRDFTLEDMPLVFWASDRVIDATATVAPEAWRRHLGLLLDGLRAEAATPLPVPPLTPSQLARAARRRRG
jgi:AcrR family transcriptional regulator